MFISGAFSLLPALVGVGCYTQFVCVYASVSVNSLRLYEVVFVEIFVEIAWAIHIPSGDFAIAFRV